MGSVTGARRGGTPPGRGATKLADVLERGRAAVAVSVDGLAGQVDGLLRTGGDDGAWAEGARTAHRIAGLGGTVGLPRISELARDLEHVVSSWPLDAGGAARARALLTQLSAEAAPLPRAGRDERPLVLLVTADLGRAGRLQAAAGLRGLRLELLPYGAATVDDVVGRLPAAAVVIESSGGLDEQAAAVLRSLEAIDTGPTLLLVGGSLALADRVTAAQSGVTEILDSSLTDANLLDAVARHVEDQAPGAAVVLAVDDDGMVLDAVRAVLDAPDLGVVALNDPVRFWEAVDEHCPDLLVMDIDMPAVSGLDLCRTIRADGRWRGLPVLVLSANTDPAVVRAVFEAGADDYVAKPFVGPELEARIRNRLERARLHRQLAETDALTGLANRRKLEDQLQRMTSLSARHGHGLALAVLDVDHFKQVNDRYGHDAGDDVLRALARHLVNGVRAEDVVARIGGEEFVVAMLGTGMAAAVRQLSGLLGSFRAAGVTLPSGRVLHVGASGGVAEFPRHGDGFHELYRLADTALFAAKAAGRGRVLAATAGRKPSGREIPAAHAPGAC